MTKAIFSILLIVCSIVFVNGQEAKNSELHLILKKQDSIFFERAFNLCDFEYLNKTIHKDLIFFTINPEYKIEMILWKIPGNISAQIKIKNQSGKLIRPVWKFTRFIKMVNYMERFKMVFMTFLPGNPINRMYTQAGLNLRMSGC